MIVLPDFEIVPTFPPDFPLDLVFFNYILGISPNEYFPAIFFGSTRHPPEQDYAKIGLFRIMSRFMSIFIGPYVKPTNLKLLPFYMKIKFTQDKEHNTGDVTKPLGA